MEETVRNGVTIVNDSKSTSTSSLNQAIKTYNKNNLILLVGGYNKNLDFSFLNKYKFKSLICFGRLSKEIESILKADFFFDNLKEAAEKAFNMAVNDDIVLFSPGCASFDEFDSYLKRGEAFESYIREHYDK